MELSLLSWYEDRWRSLVKEGYSDAEAFGRMKELYPERTQAYLEHQMGVLEVEITVWLEDQARGV